MTSEMCFPARLRGHTIYFDYADNFAPNHSSVSSYAFPTSTSVAANSQTDVDDVVFV